MWTKQQVCNLIDLTSLNPTDSKESITLFIENAKTLEKRGFPVAAICVFPNFASLAVDLLKDTTINVAVVAGNFPNSQGFLTNRLEECKMALDLGVDEVDIVLNLGEFTAGNNEKVVAEIKAFKALMPNKILKVILETGCLKTDEKIETAAQLAIEGGADFLKTSTGKVYPGATPSAVETIAKVANAHRIYTDKEIGIKVSGGVRSYETALEYIAIIEKWLGDEFIQNKNFRIGASSLVDHLTNA